MRYGTAVRSAPILVSADTSFAGLNVLEEEFSEVRMPPVLCDWVSYVEVHKPIDVYIRNLIPDDLGIPLLEHLALSGRGIYRILRG